MLISALVMAGVGLATDSLRGMLLLAILVASTAGILSLMPARTLLRWAIRRFGNDLFGAAELTCDAKGLRLTTRSGTIAIAWTQLTHVREDGRTVTFEWHRLLSALVPQTAFAFTEERGAFMRYARDQIAKASG